MIENYLKTNFLIKAAHFYLITLHLDQSSANNSTQQPNLTKNINILMGNKHALLKFQE